MMVRISAGFLVSTRFQMKTRETFSNFSKQIVWGEKRIIGLIPHYKAGTRRLFKNGDVRSNEKKKREHVTTRVVSASLQPHVSHVLPSTRVFGS